MKIIWKKNEEIRKDEPKPKWTYKIYITNDATNNQLVESLAPINWAEFLNRPISKAETEDILIHEVQKDEHYIIGKRLVKFLYEIPNVKVLVCELARLTPLPPTSPQRIIKLDPSMSINLDEEKVKENKQKIKQIELKESPKGNIYV